MEESKTKMEESEVKIEEPKTEGKEPKTEGKEPKTEVKEPKTEVKEPKAESQECDPYEIINDIDENTTVHWTYEKVQKYILSKIGSLLQDPKHNPLFAMKNNIETVTEEMQQLCDKYMKLQKSVEYIGREQLLFLTRIGAEPKIVSKDVGIGVDFPPLPETERFSYSFNASGRNKVTAVAKPLVKKSPGPVECIDLTNDEEPSPPATVKSNEKEQTTTSTPVTSAQNVPPSSGLNQTKHPAPLPSLHLLGEKAANIPPKPVLKISVAKNGIVLQWDMPPEAKSMNITNFEIYGYQEKSNVSVSSTQWERIGHVHAMPLPMSCTLTQFVQGCKYHFSIRAITNTNKPGHFSDPASIMFVTDEKKK